MKYFINFRSDPDLENGNKGENESNDKDNNGKISQGSLSKPDITISMFKKDFIDIVNGKISGQAAFMKGKLKVDGKMPLAMKLEILLKTLSGNPISKL